MENFVEIEEKIKSFWDEHESFKKSDELSKGRPMYTFYDGPPFATGLPHYGHILSGTIKDTITRFFYQQGYSIERKFGWDCHGLPVEYEIDKKLGISSHEDVMKIGISNYNRACKDIVLKYTSEWEYIVGRMGRWVDFKNGYRTMDTSFMESVWAVFHMLYQRGLIYRGFRVMPFSTACSTPLSNFEANQNYKEVSDPSILVSFPLLSPLHGYEASLIAWTTTPWTLPSHCVLLVSHSFVYALFKFKNKFFIMHKERIKEYFEEYEIIKEISGKELIGLEYTPPFSHYESKRNQGFFRVYEASFITSDEGSGIVHCAPGFGEEDYRVCVEHGLIKENEAVPCPVDDNGCFTDEIPEYSGKYVKECDKLIVRDLKERILMNKRIHHRYPFCWRSDTPLLYKLVPNWFIRVTSNIPGLLKNNEKINWVPEGVKYKKFHNWLANARDWAVSRNRYWGTPIPLWVNKDYSKVICIGSIEELERRGNKKGIKDIHREFIDDIIIEEDGEIFHRVEEVLDCWFESGSMPYAQNHWPFNKKELTFPADFIGEGIDQTRGWFYTLHAISTLLFDKPSFKNVVVNGIVLAEDGKKMSKRLKNYPDPMEVVNKYGADSLRFYLISSPVVEGENLRFTEKGVKDVLRNLIIPWFNSLKFYKECCITPSSESILPLDGWILSSISNLLDRISHSMKEYKLMNILPFSLSFIDDLSNWYIRMNRKALRNGSYRVLGEVLRLFSIIMAPFTPFFAEYCFQEVLNDSGYNERDFNSVHYQLYPDLSYSLNHPFNEVKRVIEGIRHAREANKISLKTPLKSCVIVVDCANLRSNITDYSAIIKEECNLLNIELRSFKDFDISYSVKPNFSVLSKKEQKKERIEIIRRLSNDNINILYNSEFITIEGLVISKEDVLFECKTKDFVNFNDFGLVLDLTVDDLIVEMKVAREFNGFIQRMRKRCGLKIEDEAWIRVENEELGQLAKKYYEIVISEGDGELLERGVFNYKEEDVTVELYKY
ncbi:putative isoleucine--tRNA ligase, cytoplasmic [Astathelohania contejeani]|uniref:isoleucine--tRNA ligase n=1 Tax=Astathelohania contejeani TaxID=164912 RepID=A0ABQ7HX36_9MICR|nr:putative isoleucine--tRNA ligase, cytoplasmic [Thelohania contejeani]